MVFRLTVLVSVPLRLCCSLDLFVVTRGSVHCHRFRFLDGGFYLTALGVIFVFVLCLFHSDLRCRWCSYCQTVSYLFFCHLLLRLCLSELAFAPLV